MNKKEYNFRLLKIITISFIVLFLSTIYNLLVLGVSPMDGTSSNSILNNTGGLDEDVENLFILIENKYKNISTIEVNEDLEILENETYKSYKKNHKIEYDEEILKQLVNNVNYNKKSLLYNSNIYAESKDGTWFQNGESVTKGFDINTFFKILLENKDSYQINHNNESLFVIKGKDNKFNEDLIKSLGIKVLDKDSEHSNIQFELQLNNENASIAFIKVFIKTPTKDVSYNYEIVDINKTFELPVVEE